MTRFKTFNPKTFTFETVFNTKLLRKHNHTYEIQFVETILSKIYCPFSFSVKSCLIHKVYIIYGHEIMTYFKNCYLLYKWVKTSLTIRKLLKMLKVIVYLCSSVLSQMTDVPDNRRPRWPKIRHSVRTKIF